MNSNYDVVILGGGLAGLTLSLQLKKGNPDLKILVLERRKTPAAIATHKVGESTVELGSHYLREVVGLKSYLEEHELPKYGMRVFFNSKQKNDITTRVELGPRRWLFVPTHQIDRGMLENHMVEKLQNMSTNVDLDSVVKDVMFEEAGNTVTYTQGGEEKKAIGRWVIDATGRGAFLKRKLGFEMPMDHSINSVWWRMKGVIDIDQWSDDEEWRGRIIQGLRYLSTVHFMDKGYWVWVIPLGTKNTSIGIVADPAVHPFENFNTYEKAMDWLKVNEPQVFDKLDPIREDKMDFKILKHFAHHTGRLYNGEQRWGVTGEAGAFLDPFYSPGTDFIAMNNSWLSDLILRDARGEDVKFRTEIYEQTHLALINAWIPIYQNKYPLMGKPQVMVSKIMWDWAIYWSVPCLLFTNNAFTDLRLLKTLFSSTDSLGQRFGRLHDRVQQLFLDWGPYENTEFSNYFFDPMDLNFMLEFQKGIDQNEGDKLVEKVAKNMATLEQFAVELFRRISHEVKGTPMNMPVDPYTMVLDPENNLMLTAPDPVNCIEPSESLKKDIDVLWLYKKKEMAYA